MSAPVSAMTDDHWAFLQDPNHVAILDSVAEGVYVVDQNRVIRHWNTGAEQLSGFSRTEVIGRSCREGILTHCDDRGRCLCNEGCPLAATVSDGSGRETTVYMHHRDGHRVPVRVRSLPIHSADGVIIGAVETFRDDSVERAATERIRRLAELALLDPLTGLPNRRCIQSRIERAFAGGEHPAVLLADVDRFKRVNDRWGHETGDALLQMVGKSLRAAFTDSGMVGRWGGEEFLGVAQNVSGKELARLADRARVLVEQSYINLPTGILNCTISMGATVLREGEAVSAAIDRADRLLYASKTGGRNRATVEE